MFNTESHYSTYCLQQGVTVDSRESFLKILKDSPCLKRDVELQSRIRHSIEKVHIFIKGELSLDLFLIKGTVSSDWIFLERVLLNSALLGFAMLDFKTKFFDGPLIFLIKPH